MSYGYGKSIVTDGLVFYVDAGNSSSYPGSGTTWTDLIGSNNGTLTNGPAFNSANAGNIDFDGSNDKVTFSTDLFSGSNEGTLMLVINPDTTSFDGKFFNQSGTLVNGSTFAFTPETGGIRYRHYGGNITYGAGTMSAGNIYHIAVVIPSGASTTDDVLAYIDGVNYSGSRTGGSDQTLNIGTGTTNLGHGTSSGDYFEGKIYYTMVYDRALTASEILQNYNALKNRFV